MSTEVQTVTASKAMPGLPTGMTDRLLQNLETRSGAPMSRMAGAIPLLPVHRRGADMENITITFTREGEVKGQRNEGWTSPRTAIRQ